MEYRLLGRSGFKVPALTLGTGTFAGRGEFFAAWGATEAKEATRLLDICLDAGLNMFDSADIYSAGGAEEVLGAAIKGRRDKVLISTKYNFRAGEGPNDAGSSRFHILKATDAALKRLGHRLYRSGAASRLRRLDPGGGNAFHLRRADPRRENRYIGVSNFSGWQLMKSLAASERYGYPRYVAHQAYYSLIGRDYESELMPLALDQGVGAVVWSPLGWGRLTAMCGAASPFRRKAAFTRPPISGRRSRTNIFIASWMRWMKCQRKPARPYPRSRSTGSCSGPAFRRW